MKNILKNTLIFTIILCFFIYILNYNQEISNKVIASYNIWLTKILPILFPTFIISDIITNSNIPYYLEKITKINYIYLISPIFGSPTNAYILNNYNIDITKYLAVTNYPSLLFTYTFIKLLLGSKRAILIIISNILSNILITIKIRPTGLKNTLNHNNINIINSITKSMNTNINILGTIIFFNILPTELITNKYIKLIIISLLEITNSYTYLLKSNLSIFIKTIFIIISTSTTGLCIQTQVLNITNKINQKKYLVYKIVHLFIHLSIYHILFFLFK